MKILICKALFVAFTVTLFINPSFAQVIPLPEHPRPDFMRADWLNLNGSWEFRFDRENIGEQHKWFENAATFDKKIMVPFSWGCRLSGVENEADIGWYARTIQVPAGWVGRRVFVVVGASDWRSTAWLNGHLLGTYQGGYTPFEFEITPYIVPGKDQLLVIRVDDSPHPFKLEGKQGYGNVRGIWQTIYLEARGSNFIKSLHFTPDIDASAVQVKVSLAEPAATNLSLKLSLPAASGSDRETMQEIRKGQTDLVFVKKIEAVHLWSLDDPFLYDAEASLSKGNRILDRVQSYFGMRKISIMKLPGLEYPYIAINNKPLYLQLTLDQSYNADGYYTFPSDEFMKQEILRSKRLGLSGNRIHIKVEVPRKLYWADKLGLLIMADVPNSWGEPDSLMRNEWTTAMEGLIERDYNHPAIFSWVLFNETWGLFSTAGEKKERAYQPVTQKWVEAMYRKAKALDPSRLVEDNSACNNDHVATDVNSWHQYLPGYDWESYLDTIVKNTYPGSGWNFVPGKSQGSQPMMNSECGNVWGYEGSTGDVDWSWDYHLMLNEFRMHPKIAGWLYTEHHDVINEWNGYYRYDRSNKYTGIEELVPGMSLNDLHSAVYLSIPGPLCRPAAVSASVELPLYLSCMTDRDLGRKLVIRSEMYGWDFLGRRRQLGSTFTSADYSPWMNRMIDPLKLQMPPWPGLVIIACTVEDASGHALQHNFTAIRVGDEHALRDETISENGTGIRLVRFAPASFADSQWSLRQWNIFDGLKVNGAGSGFFEYHVAWPAGLKVKDLQEASITVELSAKQLYGKDAKDKAGMAGDYMRGKGTADPSRNPNSYPMTDDYKYPSMVRIQVNGVPVVVKVLNDDPADHRGILSWYAQPHNNRLNEAGSYGYLVHAVIPKEALQRSEGKNIVVRFEVDPSLPGGVAIYGEQFGRYPLDPTLEFVLQK